MHKEVRPAAHGYLLPPDAHRALCLTRDHLKLLARLAEPSHAAIDDIMLSRETLYDLFERVAKELDGVLDSMPEKSG